MDDNYLSTTEGSFRTALASSLSLLRISSLLHNLIGGPLDDDMFKRVLPATPLGN
jgi:hypothetical protein